MPILKCLGCKYYDKCEFDEPLRSIKLTDEVFITCEAIQDLRSVFSSMKGNLFVEYFDFSKEEKQNFHSDKFFRDYEEIKK